MRSKSTRDRCTLLLRWFLPFFVLGPFIIEKEKLRYGAFHCSFAADSFYYFFYKSVGTKKRRRKTIVIIPPRNGPKFVTAHT